MVKAWYINDNDDEDKRSERHLSPPKYVSMDYLKSTVGVLYWNIDADNYESNQIYKQIRAERGYNYADVLELDVNKLPDYEDKLNTFFTEHIHSDEEIRFVLGGIGYFDVRDLDDRWVRILTEKNDLIVLPAGIYHRFSVDMSGYFMVNRLFVDSPVWIAYNRPADDHPARVKYLKSFPANNNKGEK